MNEFLAELYGTRDAIGTEDSSDVEKLAEAQILDDVLQSEGIDVDQLDDGTILKLAYEIFGDDSQLVKSAAEGEEEEEDEEEEEEEESAEEKTAEADMLGRIMAHSMVQELGNIELEKEAGAGEYGSRRAWKAIRALRKQKKSPKGTSSSPKPHKDFKVTDKSGGPGRQIGSVEGNVRELLHKAGPTARRKARQAGEHVARNKGKYMAGGGTALAVGGFAAGKKKAASAIVTLAEQRALEILAENGIGVDDSQDKLASAVEQRAWEMLAANGYVE